MRKISIIIILITGLLIGLFFSVRFNESSVFKNAQQTEASGNLQKALSMYAQALIEIAPEQNFPDINRSKIAEPSIWEKNIEQYIAWIKSDDIGTKNRIQECFEGIERCKSAQKPVNSLGKTVSKELNKKQYLSEWNKTFFASTVKPDPSQKPLAEGNHLGNLSIINLSSSKNYTYEINLVSKKTGKTTSFKLYPESNIRILAIPGQHFLICRSTVTFQTGEIWKSPFEVISLTLPDKSTLISTDLRTRVYRNK